MATTSRFVSLSLGLATMIAMLFYQPTQAGAPARTERLVPVEVAQTTPSGAASAIEKETIHQVVGRYYDAFAKDSAAASAFFGEPTLIVLPDKVMTLSTRADVEAFLAKLLGSLKPLGYSYSTLSDYRVKMLNATTALYSTVAVRMKADGTPMQRSGFTYLLHKGSAGWTINGLIATDLDKLVTAD